MLDTVDLSLTIPKRAAKEIGRIQQDRLFELAEEVYTRKVPVIIVFEGWDAAGKGTSISRLIERLDPRGFKVLPTRAALPHEQRKPWLWRFWMNIPRHGQIAIFDRSWYGRVMVERVSSFCSIPDWIRAYEEINDFERTLAADGTVFVKFFLHISKAEQLRRFILLTEQPETAWQITADDWEQHRRYDEYLAAVNDMLVSTHRPLHAPWTVVPATDRNYLRYTVFQTVIRRLEEALGFEPMAEPDLSQYTEDDTRVQDVEAAKAAKAAKKAEKEAGKQAEKQTRKEARQAGQQAAAPAVEKAHNGKASKKAKKAALDALLSSGEYAAPGKQKKHKVKHPANGGADAASPEEASHA